MSGCCWPHEVGASFENDETRERKVFNNDIVMLIVYCSWKGVLSFVHDPQFLIHGCHCEKLGGGVCDGHCEVVRFREILRVTEGDCHLFRANLIELSGIDHYFQLRHKQCNIFKTRCELPLNKRNIPFVMFDQGEVVNQLIVELDSLISKSIRTKLWRPIYTLDIYNERGV